MDILGTLIIAIFIILIPVQVYFRLSFLVIKRISIFHLSITTIEFCIFSFLYIYAFTNFDGDIHEKHLLSRSWSWFILYLGYLAYFSNNLLADKKPGKMETLFPIFMWISLAYSLFFIFELVLQNQYEIYKLIFLQLPYTFVIIFGLFIYHLRPAKEKISFGEKNVHF